MKYILLFAGTFLGSLGHANCNLSVQEMRSLVVGEEVRLYDEMVTETDSRDHQSFPSRSDFRTLLETFDSFNRGDLYPLVEYRTLKFYEHSCQPYVQCRYYVQFYCEDQRAVLYKEIDPE